MLVPPSFVVLSLLVSASQPVTLTAEDGVTVHGEQWTNPDKAAPAILLFHQAGSSLEEYRTIAPRLSDLGYHVLAIDQRSGGSLFKKRPNQTAAAYRRKTQQKKVPYLAALPDLEAAYAHLAAQQRTGPVLVWGSSYSAALVFLLAARHPDIDGVLAFSPGEYLGKTSVGAAAKTLHIPVFIATPQKEKARAQKVAQALARKTPVLTPAGAVHGSSMLIQSRCTTAAANWALVESFLKQHAPVDDGRNPTAPPGPKD